MKKMKLQIETLAVDSFATDHAADERGTVRGQAEECTWFESCLCETAYYHCGTGPHTIHSCDYTQTWRCRDTFRCPTPPITPGCTVD